MVLLDVLKVLTPYLLVRFVPCPVPSACRAAGRGEQLQRVLKGFKEGLPDASEPFFFLSSHRHGKGAKAENRQGGQGQENRRVVAGFGGNSSGIL